MQEGISNSATRPSALLFGSRHAGHDLLAFVGTRHSEQNRRSRRQATPRIPSCEMAASPNVPNDAPAPRVVIVDYGMGNLHSVKRKLHRIGIQGQLTSDPGELVRAEKLLLPGVGHFGKAMEHL